MLGTKFRLRHALLMGCAAMGMGAAAAVAPPAFAQQATRAYQIAPQDLDDALREFARQSGRDVLFTPDIVAGKRSPGVQGQLTERQALDALLAGTDLRVEQTASNGFVVQNPASPTRLGAADQTASSDEIIVTAQKRAERLQDVPISMSVLGGDHLDRSNDQGVTEALNRVPGVATNVTAQGGGTQVTVRGVTAASALFAGSAPIAYYLDSAPFGFVNQAIAPDVNAYDLERVEVLRGPQGTLYGASALNGVVRVLTHDADLDRFEFKGRTSVSSTADGGQNHRGDMAVNMPIVPGMLAARVAVGYEDLSGWVDSPNNKDRNDTQISNVRLRINSHPADNLSIGVSAWLSRADTSAPDQANDSGNHRSLVNEPISTDTDVYSLRVGYEFPGFSLASSTSYIDYALDSSLDQTIIGSTKLITNLAAQTFSQEIILNSLHEQSWRWSLGGFYRKGQDNQFQLRPTYLAPANIDSTSESFAVFGELTRIFLGGQFELTGGLRHFQDDVKLDENSRSTGVPSSQFVHTDHKFDALSPRVVLTWHPGDQMTVYGSYSQGFRSGGAQSPAVVAIAPQFTPPNPDTLRNYEVGAKGSLWNGRVNFDSALYYIDWQDVQINLTVAILPGPPPIFNTVVINGASASGFGADFGVSIEPFSGLELGATLSWNDLRVDSNVVSSNVILFHAGDRLNLSPAYTAGASADYSFPLGGNGFEGALSLSANYISEQDNHGILGGLFIGRGDPLLTVRSSFSIHSPDHWAATLFVDNLTNELGSPNKTAFQTLLPEWDARLRPRTVGLQLEYRY